jgi:hypothetical protein
VLGEFMSYDIDGYIELQAYDTYFAAINLFPFIYMTDYVSNRLFGLTKYPHDPIAFEKRGIPIDASETVKEEYQKNEEFISKYGEGCINHTYATWEEIQTIDLTIGDDENELEKKSMEYNFFFNRNNNKNSPKNSNSMLSL